MFSIDSIGMRAEGKVPQPDRDAGDGIRHENFRELLRGVGAFAFDVDGVFTNNQVLISESGVLLRNANTRDGYAVAVATRAGIPIAVITGGRTESVRRRFLELGVKYVYLGVRDKLEVLEEFSQLSGVPFPRICFMGDDMPDWEAMRHCGMPACPVDAAPEVRAIARYISPVPGGMGCVRDILEQYLKLHGLWKPGESAHQ